MNDRCLLRRMIWVRDSLRPCPAMSSCWLGCNGMRRRPASAARCSCQCKLPLKFRPKKAYQPLLPCGLMKTGTLWRHLIAGTPERRPGPINLPSWIDGALRCVSPWPGRLPCRCAGRLARQVSPARRGASGPRFIRSGRQCVTCNPHSGWLGPTTCSSLSASPPFRWIGLVRRWPTLPITGTTSPVRSTFFSPASRNRPCP